MSCSVITHNNTVIVCNAPPNEGLAKSVYVTVSGLVSNSLIVAYAAPTLVSISPTTGLTSGSANLTISGANFGFNPVVTIGGVLCPLVFYDSSSVGGQSSLICSSPVGQGTNKVVQVSVASQRSNYLSFSYSGPVISSIYPSGGPTSGGVNITITGLSFGSTGAVTLSCK